MESSHSQEKLGTSVIQSSYLNSKVFSKLKSRGSFKSLKQANYQTQKFEISSITNYRFNLLFEILDDTPNKPYIETLQEKYKSREKVVIGILKILDQEIWEILLELIRQDIRHLVFFMIKLDHEVIQFYIYLIESFQLIKGNKQL